MQSAGLALALVGAATTLGGLALAGACGALPSVVVPTDGGASPSSSGGHGASEVGGGGTAGAFATGGGGTASTPLYLGVTPTPGHVGPGEASASERLDAQLTVRAVGARSLFLALPWRDLEANGAAIAAQVAQAQGLGLRVVIDLMLTDRLADLRPAQVSGTAWDAPALAAALAPAIDALTALGPDVLLFGRQLDRYLAAHAAEGNALRSLLTWACARVGTAAVPPRTGVSLGREGGDLVPSTFGLESLGDLVGFSYFPGLGTPTVAPALAPADGLDAMLATAGGRPIVIERVGVGTSAVVGGSEAQQAQFFVGLFTALAPRRSRVPYLDVHELTDPPADDCSAYVASQGEPLGGPFGAYVCSDGVRTAAGVPKAAWSAVVAGLAAFAAP